MNKDLAPLLAERKRPTHIAHGRLSEALAPVAEVVGSETQQIARARALLLAAEVKGGHLLRQKTERIHQSLGAMERASARMIQALRELAAAHDQYERVVDEVDRDLSTGDEVAAGL